MYGDFAPGRSTMQDLTPLPAELTGRRDAMGHLPSVSRGE